MKIITRKPWLLGASALLLLSTSAANLHAEDVSAWGKRALKIQNKIDNDAPLSETTWLATHNSMANNEDDDYWSFVWNQPYGLDNQMSRGVRSIGLDVHYSDGAVRVCHNNLWSGYECVTNITGDRLFKYALADIADYISANPTEVILLKFEMADSADGAEALGEIAGDLSDQLGDILLRTDDSIITEHGDADGNDIFGATYLPADTLTKSKILAMGANVVVYAGSSTYRHAGLNDMIFYQGSSYSSIGSLSDMQNISDNNKRTKMYKKMDGSVKSDAGSSGNNDIHPSDTQDWLAAGVNFLEVYGFNGSSAWDIDGESAVSSEDVVWSWDEEHREPDTSSSNYARLNVGTDRFRDANGTISYYAACRKLVESDGTRAYDDWMITSEKITFDEAEEQCLTDGGGEYFFATPRNKPELEVLISTRNVNHSSEDLLLNYEKDSDGAWNADIGEADVDMYDYCEAGGTGTICSYLDSYLDSVGLNSDAEEIDPRDYESNDYYTWEFRSDGKLQMSNNLWSGDDNGWGHDGGACFEYKGDGEFGVEDCDDTEFGFTLTDSGQIQLDANPWGHSGGACFSYLGDGDFGKLACDSDSGEWRTNDFGQVRWSSNPWGLSNGACFEYESNDEFGFHGCY